jgi:diguanylate cyclase (GGDEF)-like protein
MEPIDDREPLDADSRRRPSGPSRRQGERVAEAAKRAALHELDLGEAGAPAAFDRLAALAARLLAAPVALVTVIHADRQVLLGRHGFDGKVAEGREMALGHSFGEHAVELRIPLILDDGEVVGAFRAIDREPRSWSDEDLEILDDLASVATEILGGRAALVHHGLHDRLTGLPNRELLVASCDDFIQDLGPDEHVAVLCAGLDHFNVVNQAFGTEKADRVLRAVAERFVGSVRETDVFGRLRGDVFALVAPGIADEAEALKLAARIRRVLSEAPLDIEGQSLSLGATLGVAIGGAGAAGSDLVSDAANAMREAKRSQGRVRVAERAHAESAAAHLRLREALHLACERDEIEAHFQPIVALETHRVAGYEALARWTSATLGPVSPGEFIPLAELTSDIVEIGELMIGQAAAFAAALREIVGEEVRVTLNAAPSQLDRTDFAVTVRSAFEAHGLTGRSVGIEITEGTLLESGELERANLGMLRAFGAHVLLDDFGTGYSSLAYLRDFEIDTIKVDRSFIDRMVDDRHSASLIQAILAMARGIEMEVVAEGIETEEQAKLLRLLGCRYGQGFGLGRPIDARQALAAAAPADGNAPGFARFG